MSIVGKRGHPVITIRDVGGSLLKASDLGAIAMNGQTLDFRVYNNFTGLPGIPKAAGIVLDLKASPKRGHTILLNDNLAIRCKCTYSAKLTGDPGDSFNPFPISNTNFNEIGNGEYNQYQLYLDGTQLTDDQKSILNGKEWKLYIVAGSVSGGLELVQS